MQTLNDILRHHSVEPSSAEEIVLFGSRVDPGCEDPSDWDVLCVGYGKTRLGRELDVVWVTPEEVESTRWLTSELGTHIARYGRWLRGPGSWKGSARVDEKTVAAKHAGLGARIRGYGKVWPRLGTRSRRRFGTKIRRDVQRLAILSAGEAVPARPTLDRLWAADPNGLSWAARARFFEDLSLFWDSAA